MLSKINIVSIIKDHLKTLKNFQSGKYYWGDIFIFFVLPLIATIILIFKDFSLKDELVQILITSFSIFTALLFNLLLLTFDIVKKNITVNSNEENKKENAEDKSEFDVLQKIKILLLKEIYANISYSILMSILCLVFLMLTQVEIKGIYLIIIKAFIFFISINFLGTLFQILKRIHSLLSNEF